MKLESREWTRLEVAEEEEEMVMMVSPAACPNQFVNLLLIDSSQLTATCQHSATFSDLNQQNWGDVISQSSISGSQNSPWVWSACADCWLTGPNIVIVLIVSCPAWRLCRDGSDCLLCCKCHLNLHPGIIDLIGNTRLNQSEYFKRTQL